MFLLSEGEGPLYLRLYRDLRGQIRDGTLEGKLPSKRAMASRLGVSVNTVDAAYAQLLSEGYVEARARSGFYVRRIEALQRVEPPAELPPEHPRAEDSVLIDFAPGRVSREKFPFSVWQRLLKECLAGPDSLRRAPPEGDSGLRRAVAAYLRAARGVRCGEENIVIGAGTGDLLALLAFLLPARFSAAIENPVYNRGYRVFEQTGHRIVPAEIDKQGVMVEPLEELEHVLLYTTPSHQYPLGIAMPAGRRAQLLNWAGRGRERFILEDDYDSEFRYDARPVPPLQSADENGRVAYLGTFSGSVAPSLRVSYLVLPPALLARYRAERPNLSCAVSTLEQAALREFLLRGHFETHLNRMRVFYRAKRARLLNALSPLKGAFRSIGEAAGHHLTLQALNGLTEAELIRLALGEGVKVYPVSPCFIGDCPYEGKVLLGFGDLSDAQIDQGAAALCRAWGRGSVRE